MPDTANNPQTPEEALAEYREVVAPVAFYDECPLNDLKVENKTIRPPTMHLIIPKTALHNINRNRKDPFNPVENDNMWYPKAQAGILSLKDYQSLAVHNNVVGLTDKLAVLCAQQKQEEADKILPGFYERYASKFTLKKEDRPLVYENEDYKSAQQYVRENFGTACPTFLKDTETRWKEDSESILGREEKKLSDAGYYAIIRGHYYAPTEENNRYTANIRQLDIATLHKLERERLKQEMHEDFDKAFNRPADEMNNDRNPAQNATAPSAADTAFPNAAASSATHGISASAADTATHDTVHTADTVAHDTIPNAAARNTGANSSEANAAIVASLRKRTLGR